MKKQVNELRDAGFLKLARISYVLESCKTLKQATDTINWGQTVLNQHFNPSWKYEYGFSRGFEISSLSKQFQEMLNTIVEKNEILKNVK